MKNNTIDKEQRIDPTTEELIADIQRVISENPNLKSSLPNYMMNGKYTFGQIIKCCKNWTTAKRLAGFETAYHNEDNLKNSASEKDIIADIKRVAKELKTPNLRYNDYIKNGKHAQTRLLHLFGSWNNAKIKAGLPVNAPGEAAVKKRMENIAMKNK